MKRSLLVLAFLIGISFSTLDSNLIILRHRHVVEYSLENHSRQLTDDEVIRGRAAIYLKLSMILAAAARLEMGKENYFNTS